MLKLAPEDSKLIKSFTSDLRTLSKSDIPFRKSSLNDLLRMLPVYRLFPKYSMTVQEFAKNFRNPALRK